MAECKVGDSECWKAVAAAEAAKAAAATAKINPDTGKGLVTIDERLDKLPVKDRPAAAAKFNPDTDKDFVTIDERLDKLPVKGETVGHKGNPSADSVAPKDRPNADMIILIDHLKKFDEIVTKKSWENPLFKQLAACNGDKECQIELLAKSNGPTAEGLRYFLANHPTDKIPPAKEGK